MRDVASAMNRLDQTKSDIFKLWMLYFQRISFQIILGHLYQHPVQQILIQSFQMRMPDGLYSDSEAADV